MDWAHEAEAEASRVSIWGYDALASAVGLRPIIDEQRDFMPNALASSLEQWKRTVPASCTSRANSADLIFNLEWQHDTPGRLLRLIRLTLGGGSSDAALPPVTPATMPATPTPKAVHM